LRFSVDRKLPAVFQLSALAGIPAGNLGEITGNAGYILNLKAFVDRLQQFIRAHFLHLPVGNGGFTLRVIAIPVKMFIAETQQLFFQGILAVDMIILFQKNFEFLSVHSCSSLGCF
jgi:hypothetical protein